MKQALPDTSSLWAASRLHTTYPSLAFNIHVDAVVIGGGITGLTAAYLLKQARKTVAVVERRRVGFGETGHTTAHLTAVTDTPLSELVSQLGPDHAHAVWDAGFAAIARIRATVRDERINCRFGWVRGCLHAPFDGDPAAGRDAIDREVAAAESMGIDATFVDQVPGIGRPGVVFESQARFHPLSYLDVLADRVQGHGSYVFEDTEIDTIEGGDPVVVRSGPYRITAEYLVAATHVPLMSAVGGVKETFLQADLFPYTTYAVAGIAAPTALQEGLYWEHTPGAYEYLRVDRMLTHDEVILGGQDHKTGQGDDTVDRLLVLEERLRQRVPGVQVTHRWSGQVLETRDGLPYIGEMTTRRFASTGYAGNGMTFGTLGGMMAADAMLGRANPWRDLFNINRTRVLTGAWNYLVENKDYPYYLIRDRFTGPAGKPLRAVPRGEGEVVRVGGKDVAAYRDEDGHVTTLSPECTHLGCRVTWNAAEKTWDCPCHGSRFTATGDVIAGPAEAPLRPA